MMYDGELTILDGEVCFNERLGVNRNVLIPINDMREFESRFGSFPATIARFLTLHQSYNQQASSSCSEKDRRLVWPKSIEGKELLPHQIDVLDTIIRKRKGKAIVPLIMGMGKTVIGVLGAAYYGGPALFVCPVNKRDDWKRHIVSWASHKFKYVVILEKVEQALILLQEFPLSKRCEMAIVIAFSIASRPEVIQAMKSWLFHSVVVDEAHLFKSSDSQRAKAIFALTQRSKCCLLLTANPAMNRPSEIYALLHAMHPAVFSHFNYFSQRYCNGFQDRWKWKERGLIRVTELHHIIEACQATVPMEVQEAFIASLPKKTREIVTLPAPSQDFHEEMKSLRNLEAKYRKQMEEASFEEAYKQAKTRRFKVVANMNKLTRLTKIIPCVDYIIKNEVDKVEPKKSLVVFCAHKIVAITIQEELKKSGIKSVVVTGGMSGDKRQKVLEQFKDGTRPDDCFVAILTIKASGCGIELAPGVTRVVFVQIAFTPSDIDQAEARAHRIGTTDEIHCTWLVMEGSYDDDVLSIMNNKQQTLHRMFDTSDAAAACGFSHR